MIRQSFNDNWTLSLGGSGLKETFGVSDRASAAITLPHDAMISEKPANESKNGSQTGYYPGKNYTYTKTFHVPKEWKDKIVTIEFEGVYMNAMIYINGDYAAGRPFGYGNFYVKADDFLKYEEDNEIKVEVKNGMELNSRWYTGSGIYRNVKIMVAEKLHIMTDGIKITTPDIDEETAAVVITSQIENSGFGRTKVYIETELCNSEGMIVASDKTPLTAFDPTTNVVRQRMAVKNPDLWDCDNPSLYTCSVKIIENDTIIDEATEVFGIRKLQLDAELGLRINGKVVKLRGACIHHDNGVIGAATFERAEERRCQLLKAAGFNCIRSSHQPISKAMLEACDREGMLVMDELCDMWHNSKNDYDFSLYFEEWWERETEAMVNKDFNHPCVILYSMGNEIQEAGTAKGAQMNRRIADKIKSMDSTRYTTTAVNSIMTVMDSLPVIMGEVMQKMGVTMPAQQSEPSEEKADSSIAALNNFLSMVSGPMGDAISSHRITSERIEEIYGGMDVCGMNYMAGRYESDHELYPNRIIVGSETYPSDIVRLWSLVTKLPHVIGDMTWTGYDYLGEAGIGIPYYDGRPNFGKNWPSRSAYVGDIDLVGNRRPISYLRQVVFGLRKAPYIAVQKVNHFGEKASQTPWMYKDSLESWTWPGYEGKPAAIDVFSISEEVELFLSGISLGKKPSGISNGYVTTFETSYQPGKLVAVGYTGGEEDGRMELITAKDKVELKVEADRSQMKADGSDLSYVMISLVDQDGVTNRFIKKSVTVSVEGAGTLQGFGSADPLATIGYDEKTQDTFEGYVLAVVRAGNKQDKIKVKVSADGCREKEIVIEVR